MVPEKMCAAQDETSEQSSRKTLVRKRWWGQKGGEQPLWEQGRGGVGQLGDRCVT